MYAKVSDHRLSLVIIGQRLSWNLQRGNFLAARQAFDQLISHQVGAGLRVPQFEMLADVLHRQGLYIWAARVFGLADKLGKTTFLQRPRRRDDRYLNEVIPALRNELRHRLGEKAFARALQEGQEMKVEDLLTIPNPTQPDPLSKSTAKPTIELLTARELDVMRLLAQELSNREIAEQLVISHRTVDAHLRSIYDKLGVHSRDAAVRVAKEQGLME